MINLIIHSQIDYKLFSIKDRIYRQALTEFNDLIKNENIIGVITRI